MATERELLRMVRQFCSEWMGGPKAIEDVWPISNPGNVADCTAPDCVWFKYRFGVDPDKNPKRVALALKHFGHSTPEGGKIVKNRISLSWESVGMGEGSSLKMT